MDKKTAGQNIARRIETARESAGRSINWIAGKSGIPYTTLYRRLTQSPEDFTIRQLEAIAVSLNITAEALLLEELRAA